MRWTAERFWKERGDVLVTTLQTSNDLLRAAFISGATEAEVLGADPEPGYATVRVAGLRKKKRKILRKHLNDHAPVGTEYRVERLRKRGRDG